MATNYLMQLKSLGHTNTIRVHCSETVYNRCKDGAFKDKRLIPMIMGE